MPLFPSDTGLSQSKLKGTMPVQPSMSTSPALKPPPSLQAKNRRKRYLDQHPEYFSADLEMADPLLYDRLIRRFQSPAEREAEGRAKGFSGILQADILRSEAKMDALAHPDPNAMLSYRQGPHGEIVAEDKEDIPSNKEEGEKRWRWEMEMRFLKGADYDFAYENVDENDEYDDWNEAQERYFDEEEPEWILDESKEQRNATNQLTGETGIQDF
ncbi:coiled-coil domain-containing protein-domain-containing protein [Talaromyces proteolyticus]|uniref:Coiled-coil domain-containing protein-domain-containing protein n=1 Tax=Talaromyces proteolyticus TaxID=1131652 RepID=A0AAD4KV60_9EURO|nr:coiled-coil domain-containing protein-domain-containing protein [Talaromyces proteolyticus]KAH8701818.1 coiled-coil domain-containing protein-domain-containing protein [Talaromyces proteolyticus]